jgi:riboflavin kinase/FMN adenylyltransferase
MHTSDSRAITIGNFDGVHLGHRALLDRARALVGPGGQVVAMAFHPHPFVRLRPEFAPARIEPWTTRVRRLTDAGADRVERLEPTPELLGTDPAGFVAWLIDTHRPTHIVEGPDFHFGKGRAGTVAMLRQLAGARGVAVEVVSPVMVSLRDQSEVVASSSLVRWLLARGRVRDAAYALGRAHELAGIVVPGDRLGRTIGFPTANLDTECLPPGDGVYAAVAVLADGSEAVAAVHIGPRPAVGSSEHRVEAYLMEADGSRWTPPAGMPESGWSCTLRLIGRVRDLVKVDGLEALVGQVRRDCKRCVEIVPPMLGVQAGAGAGPEQLTDANASEPR